MPLASEWRPTYLSTFWSCLEIIRSEVSNENFTMTSPSRNEINYMWPAGTCVIVWDSIITRIDEIRLSKNRLLRLPDFRGAT